MISAIDNKTDELIMRVRSRGAMSEFCFIPAYPPHKTPNPIRQYTVAVANSEVRASCFFVGDRVAGGKRGRLYEVTLCLRVYAPERTSGAALLRASSMLIDALEAEDSDRAIVSASLSGISFDTAARTEYRDITVRLSYLIDEEV